MSTTVPVTSPFETPVPAVAEAPVAAPAEGPAAAASVPTTAVVDATVPASGAENDLASSENAAPMSDDDADDDLSLLQQIQAQQVVASGSDPSLPKDAASTPPILSQAEREEIDSRSVFVGNVHFDTTPEELHGLFSPAGTVVRVTILCDKFTGRPKGFAYIEFESTESVERALSLTDTLLHSRKIHVTRKRTNTPGMSASRGGRFMMFPGAPFMYGGYMPFPPGFRGGRFAGGSPRGRFRGGVAGAGFRSRRPS
ncbi:hypothetical protein H696_04300 [Fonticula alba]|uniref:RRM domain-containing protein n=1 Tax=Fonticula alba TaxID=691883 RepID=A0A058Z5T7_FONAL|nr:hypothetical protein H696_04300 [Fonticula alba]KCV68882.1 hypothetical protein H696_04300 [Fonticula alba]|eukprot:XP_009496453.1 hypothetical protein H696_04300 [Fonticula alba]